MSHVRLWSPVLVGTLQERRGYSHTRVHASGLLILVLFDADFNTSPNSRKQDTPRVQAQLEIESTDQILHIIA